MRCLALTTENLLASEEVGGDLLVPAPSDTMAAPGAGASTAKATKMVEMIVKEKFMLCECDIEENVLLVEYDVSETDNHLPSWLGMMLTLNFNNGDDNDGVLGRLNVLYLLTLPWASFSLAARPSCSLSSQPC